MPKNKKVESIKKNTDSKSKKNTELKSKPKKSIITKVTPKKTKSATSTKAKASIKSSSKKTSTKKVKMSSVKKAAPKNKTESKSKKTSKAKPIIVDVIKDDELELETFFSDETLDIDEINPDSAQDFFLDLEEGEVARDDNEDKLIDDSLQIEDKAKKAWSSNIENDKQRDFYDELANEINEKKFSKSNKPANRANKAKNRKSIRLYRSLAWKFLLLVSFLAAVVFYFSFTKLTIYISPEVEITKDNLFLKVASQSEAEVRPGDARTQVSGSVNEVELDVEKIYLASGEEYLGEEITGSVKIINNHNRSQSLVATTRLLSPDNKQYRLKKAVTIPAGSSLEVEIYADKISREMAMGPSRFSIPGLWVGLQDKIYAESSEAFIYKQKMQKYVKASDIQLAKSEAQDLILEKAKNIKTLRSQDKVIYKILEPFDLNLTAEAGDKIDSFTMNAKASVVIISLSEEEVRSLALTKIKDIPDDKELLDFNSESLTYVLESYDEKERVATVKVSFSGQMILKKDAKIINKDNLVSLKAPQIVSYLKDYPEIGQYDLKFYPSFIERAPYLVDRIEIKVKK